MTNDQFQILFAELAHVRREAEQSNQGVQALQHRMDSMDNRMDSMDHRMGGMEDRMGALEHRMGGIDHRMDSIDHRMGGMDNRMGAMGISLAEVRREMADSQARLGSELRTEMAESQARLASELRTELRAEIRESSEETRRHFEESRRHFAVIAEGLRGQIQLVAEGVIGLGERMEANQRQTTAELSSLDRGVSRLEGACLR